MSDCSKCIFTEQLFNEIVSLKSSTTSIKLTYLPLLLLLLNLLCVPVVSSKDVLENLLDETLSNFKVDLGVPYKTLALEDYEVGDGMEETPLGFKYSLNILTAREEGGELTL